MFTYANFLEKIGAEEARQEFAEIFESEDFQDFTETERVAALRLIISMFVDKADELGLDIGVEIKPMTYEET